jgi:uncharacterized protein YecT (DUF1311 family)
MRISKAVLTLAILGPLGVSQAEDCTNAANQTALTICADQAFKKTDAELNAVYKQITARLKDNQDASKLLVTAQKSWVSFRDAECAFSTSSAAQGSIYPMLMAQCRDSLTRKRVVELKAYLHCEEGDMSCPVPAS